MKIKPKMADGRHTNNRFLAVTQSRLSDSSEILREKAE